MRIVSGRWKGRNIKAPAGTRVRPTADRVREAWLSIVQNEIPDASVLDLFAGSGALGLEALSRGAARAVFVESNEKSLRALRGNIALLGAEAQTTIHRNDALHFIQSLVPSSFHIAFADPPYATGLAGRIAERWLDVPFADVIGIEHPVSDNLAQGGDKRSYGDTAITFYRRRMQ